MRAIPAKNIRDIVSDLCIRANTVLRKDVLAALKSAYLKETNKRAKEIEIIRKKITKHLYNFSKFLQYCLVCKMLITIVSIDIIDFNKL